MEEQKSKPAPRKRSTTPVVISDGSSTLKKKPLLKQGTTWAGLFTIAAAIATGGTSLLTDPTALTAVSSGIALLFAEN